MKLVRRADNNTARVTQLAIIYSGFKSGLNPKFLINQRVFRILFLSINGPYISQHEYVTFPSALIVAILKVLL